MLCVFILVIPFRVARMDPVAEITNPAMLERPSLLFSICETLGERWTRTRDGGNARTRAPQPSCSAPAGVCFSGGVSPPPRRTNTREHPQHGLSLPASFFNSVPLACSIYLFSLVCAFFVHFPIAQQRANPVAVRASHEQLITTVVMAAPLPLKHHQRNVRSIAGIRMTTHDATRLPSTRKATNQNIK
jgi:hypothetical protein